jgi:hypothetical protein
MKINYATEEQRAALSQETTLELGTVWKVAELSPRGLMTTSGRLGVNTLDDVVAIIIADYSNRPVDWVISLNGLVVATVHIDDSVTYP